MGSTLADLRLVDVLDIVIVAGLCWVLIICVREARARVALGGVVVIASLFWAASYLELRLTTSLLQGVITVGALITMAAHLEGKGASSFDLSGLAQKNGAVMSHVRLAAEPEDLAGTSVPMGGADLVLG